MTSVSKIAVTLPQPRESVFDPELTRPDWTRGEARDPRLLWLDKNESIDPELSTVTSRVISEIPATAVSTYPECVSLYRKLGAYLNVPLESLLLTAGADGVIRSLFEAYINPGDVVIHTVPTFAMYAVYSRMFGAKTMTLEYQPSNRGPMLSADTIIKGIGANRPKLVCLPNPDSPTGTVFSSADLRRIVEATGEVGGLILIDEASHPFYEGTAIPWIDGYPHLVIARSCAKAWGLAGLRIGYGVASPEVARMLHKVRPNYETNHVAVSVFERMLDYSDAMMASVRRINEGKRQFLAGMEKCGFRTLESHGNFLHVAFGDQAQRIHQALSDLVLYRKDFREPCLKGFSRFSTTTPELFAPVIQRIRETVNA